MRDNEKTLEKLSRMVREKNSIAIHQCKLAGNMFDLKICRIIIYYIMGVSKNRGTPKWMVYNGKPY